MKPTFPFRVEEQGKAREGFIHADGSESTRRGPHSMGTLACYLGEKEVLLPQNGRVVLEGWAYNLQDAKDKIDAFIKRSLATRARKHRSRAKKVS